MFCRKSVDFNRTTWRYNTENSTPFKSMFLTGGIIRTSLKKIETKLHALSSGANYTDRATAAYRRNDCQLFADRGCHVVNVTDPYGRILGFLDRISDRGVA
jgi:hypothetical protein